MKHIKLYEGYLSDVKKKSTKVRVGKKHEEELKEYIETLRDKIKVIVSTVGEAVDGSKLEGDYSGGRFVRVTKKIDLYGDPLLNVIVDSDDVLFFMSENTSALQEDDPYSGEDYNTEGMLEVVELSATIMDYLEKTYPGAEEGEAMGFFNTTEGK